MSFSVKMFYDGKEIDMNDVYQREVERARLALNVLYDSGAVLCLDGKRLEKAEIATLSDSDAIRACNQSKRAVGMDKINDVLKTLIDDGNADWQEKAAASAYKQNLKPLFVEAQMRGLHLTDLPKIALHALKSGVTGLPTDLAYAIHPEHYYFKVYLDKKGIQQDLVETLAEYKPFLCRLEVSYKWLLNPNRYKPCELDPDTKFYALCENFFMDENETPCKTFAMHQIKPRKGGVDLKLGLFMPEAFPQELVEGHINHFCIEFSNCLKFLNYLHDGGKTTDAKWIYERGFENKF